MSTSSCWDVFCSVGPHRVLPQSFFDDDALHVARRLLGQHIATPGVVLRIVEVEAYRSELDSACHAFGGKRTSRTAPMWGPPGHAYIYLCYGLHHLLNVVTGPTGKAAAVLVRACEPVEGLPIIRRRRRQSQVKPALLNGPGKVGQALKLDVSLSGSPVFSGAGLAFLEGDKVPDEQVLSGPRVGIEYAAPEDRDAPWRLAVSGSAWVSHRRFLR